MGGFLGGPSRAEDGGGGGPLFTGGGGRGFSRLPEDDPEDCWFEEVPRLPPRLNGGGGGGAELLGLLELLTADGLVTSGSDGRWFRDGSGAEGRSPSPLRPEPSSSE